MDDREKVCNWCCKTGSDLQRCAACKTVWYCNVQCQKKAWKSHKKVCNKTKPETSSSDTGESSTLIKACNFCGKTQVQLQRCAACQEVRYCGTQCQRRDWRSHRENCSIIRVYPETVYSPVLVEENCVTGEFMRYGKEPVNYMGKTVDNMIVKIQSQVAVSPVLGDFLTRTLWVYNKTKEYRVNIVGAEGYEENYDTISDKIIADGLPCIRKHPLLKKLYFKARLNPDSSLDIYLNCTYNNQNW